MNNILFTIIETRTGVFSIKTRNRQYAKYEDLEFNDVPFTHIYSVMKLCCSICNNKYNIGATFEIA